MLASGLCDLYAAIGRVERCPGADCPLWSVEGGRSGCALADVKAEVTGSRRLASHLLELRRALEHARTYDECTNARSQFYRRLNDEQAAEA